MMETNVLRRWVSRWVAVMAITASSSTVQADDFQNPKANIPPQATPQRRNAGEGVPPLPLPATPLRRSEKKREPSPPALIGNVTFSAASLKGTNVNWETTIIDIEKWVDFTNANLGQRYRFVAADFGKFSYDPAELPILYFTGWKELPHFDDATIGRLRAYLMDGGTWVIHSNCGRPEFNRSFEAEIRRVFPDRELAAVPTDHPLFKSFHQITEMRRRTGSGPWETIPPYLKVINIGTRAAVIFSPIDMSCGWDANAHPIEGGVLYDQNDALKLGVNIVTYALAEYQYGRFFDHQKVYHQATDATRDQVVIGQVVHNGDWDATPHGVPNLLKTIDQSTTLHVQFKRTPVDPEKGDIYSFPILLMTGQRAFAFSPEARKRLRQYFDRGGTMIIDDVIGSSEFDASVRKEIKEIYPEKSLAALPADHPLFKFVSDSSAARLAPLAAKELGASAIPPQLLVIQVDAQLPIIYSPLSLSAGWEQLPRAYDKGYADEDALKLGVNIFMYAVAH